MEKLEKEKAQSCVPAMHRKLSTALFVSFIILSQNSGHGSHTIEFVYHSKSWFYIRIQC